MLLVEDPDVERLLQAVIAQTTDEDVAFAGTLTLLSLSGDDGLATLNEVAATSAALRRHRMLGELRGALREHGWVDIF